jgi:hypothetical protein
LTHQLIVHADQVVPELGEQRSVALVSASGWALPLHPLDPSNLILRPMPTLGAGEACGLRFRLLVKELSFV